MPFKLAVVLLLPSIYTAYKYYEVSMPFKRAVVLLSMRLRATCPRPSVSMPFKRAVVLLCLLTVNSGRPSECFNAL